MYMPFVPEHVTVKEDKPLLESFDTTVLLKELGDVYKQIDAHLSLESTVSTDDTKTREETPSVDSGLDLTEDEILRILHESHNEKPPSIYDSMFE